ncbi:DNA invertase Pin-like site-specific DNA recombinase [Duganella sp. SG902]|uniref:recombinase family protein n=1 Tax=Duganella sp. SG902 TaxID=2587016 RepID=UPI00159D10D5|nr:recombinase family protein [Duganella sp. SG902]NVM77453.1 DNA invertase Pin-like site-specific DNA recombinase [Duganella sp. SG902]
MSHGSVEVNGQMGRKAAAYVRMSTETQDLSINQQLDYIARYAAGMQYTLVKVYRDEGKSGLTLRRRGGLQQLLVDILGGACDFDVLLIYDVSRWGRFLNIDEAACYEFLCGRAGVEVLYCAEAFGREALPLQHLMKDIKRLMAAERIRELSVRVFEAHAYLLRRGYKPGGAAGFGLRRVSVNADGRIRRVLEDGERKCHQTDRVMLTPGPAEEVRVVREIFRWYIEERMSYTAVARRLNQRGVPNGSGMPWHYLQVKAILTNEKYCGTLLYNRTSGKLRTSRRRNDEAEWLRCPAAHAPIVTPAELAQANAHYRLRRGLDRDAVLEALRQLYRRHGRLSYRLIEAEAGLPHSTLMIKMFGSLEAAYRLALRTERWPPDGMAQSCARRLTCQLLERVGACIARTGHRISSGATPYLLQVDGTWTLRVAVAACVCKGGYWGWRVPARAAGSDFVVCGLRGAGCDQLVKFALVQVAGLSQRTKWLGVGKHPRDMLVVSDIAQLFGLPAVGSLPDN